MAEAAEALMGIVAHAVKESLLQIAPAAGYHTAPAPDCLAVSDVAMQSEVLAADRTLLDHRISFMVECRVLGTGTADQMRQLLDLLADIRRRLLVDDRTLGGRVVTVAEFETDEADDALYRNDGSARLGFEARVLTGHDDEREKP